MKIDPGLCALWAATLAMPAAAQHQHHTPPAAPPAAAAVARPAPAKPQGALAGYRAFDAAEPLKDWRLANEEVRAAGGHAGLLKQQSTGTAPAAAPSAPVPHAHGGKR